ncbi:LLM class flavin-dependent oxidoreductase [Brachybacterium saurashtrense]|uniref:LLM class flavin-dependent oxidoreductase n=1 Tax=Brachybacterium saurashtrense TaxID=556288 RepID=A0A345YMP3_9MICO|nr:LLM class flavin-dependent oxidoreductase [Brachybacterium saurashtrense]AXK45195.1 LLM class flavin-dependent oxidoreductase [Brachybacterium saurashtrense]RRR22051.1 LLM class flavin-dependent oxidoreductase [Brachybacterium saurashtrense]
MTAPAPATRTAPRIGVVAQVEYAGLDDGRALFLTAEELGYDVGYVRVRHLQNSLASPLLFLAALGRDTSRIQLGTAVIPLRFENAGRLAEDLATADLLTGGRLRPGLGSGYSAHDAIYARAFGALPGDRAEHVDRVLHDLLSFLDGEIVAGADRHIEEVDPGSPLRIQPQAPGLRERLAYGAASPVRAAMAGHAGLGLQLATMAPDDGSGRSFEQLQLEALEAYREASRAAGHGEGHVMVSRQMLPVRTEEELERYVTLIPRERTAEPGLGDEHRAPEIAGHDAVYSRVVIDDPGTVAQALLADAVVQAADEIALVLPFGAPAADQREMLGTFADLVVPHLLTGIV